MEREMSALAVNAKACQGRRLGGIEDRKRLNRALDRDAEQCNPCRSRHSESVMKSINPTNSRPQLDPSELSKIIRRRRLCELTGVSRSTSYLREDPRSKYFDANFPKSLRIGINSVGWRLVDVLTYIDSFKPAKGA